MFQIPAVDSLQSRRDRSGALTVTCFETQEVQAISGRVGQSEVQTLLN